MLEGVTYFYLCSAVGINGMFSIAGLVPPGGSIQPATHVAKFTLRPLLQSSISFKLRLGLMS